MIAGRDRAAVADAAGEGRGVGDEMALGERPAPTEIVPLLVMPPAKLRAELGNAADHNAGARRDRAAVADVAGKNRHVADENSVTARRDRAAVADAASESRDKLDINAARPRRNRAAIGDAAREDRAAIDENAVGKAPRSWRC